MKMTGNVKYQKDLSSETEIGAIIMKSDYKTYEDILDGKHGKQIKVDRHALTHWVCYNYE